MAGGMTSFEHWTIRTLLVASGSTTRRGGVAMVKVFVGQDWAETHHDLREFYPGALVRAAVGPADGVPMGGDCEP